MFKHKLWCMVSFNGDIYTLISYHNPEDEKNNYYALYLVNQDGFYGKPASAWRVIARGEKRDWVIFKSVAQLIATERMNPFDWRNKYLPLKKIAEYEKLEGKYLV